MFAPHEMAVEDPARDGRLERDDDEDQIHVGRNEPGSPRGCRTREDRMALLHFLDDAFACIERPDDHPVAHHHRTQTAAAELAEPDRSGRLADLEAVSAAGRYDASRPHPQKRRRRRESGGHRSRRAGRAELPGEGANGPRKRDEPTAGSEGAAGFGSKRLQGAMHSCASESAPAVGDRGAMRARMRHGRGWRRRVGAGSEQSDMD